METSNELNNSGNEAMNVQYETVDDAPSDPTNNAQPTQAVMNQVDYDELTNGSDNLLDLVIADQSQAKTMFKLTDTNKYRFTTTKPTVI